MGGQKEQKLGEEKDTKRWMRGDRLSSFDSCHSRGSTSVLVMSSLRDGGAVLVCVGQRRRPSPGSEGHLVSHQS